MLLFRSEEHVQRWCAIRRRPPGGLLDWRQIWGLADGWYREDRRRPEWRRKSREEAEALLAGLGLSGSFWRL
jgi:hypothetical protein